MGSKYQEAINKINRWLTDAKDKNKQFYLVYTALFLLGIICFYGVLLINGKTNIWYYDGLKQHYYAYLYNGKYWRNFIWELLFNHRLVLKEWDYALGEGADILSSLHFYVIGDPLTLPTIVIPTRFMWCYYFFASVLRIYLSGVAFSYMVFALNKKVNRFSVLIGTCSYAFCFWSLFCSVRHPNFINPLIYMPLVVLGVEKIIQKKSPKIFMIAVFLLAISNFYFFYVQVLLTIFYVAIRLIYEYKKDIKAMTGVVFKLTVYSLSSVCFAMIIVLPVLFSYLSDNRIDNTRVFSFLYDYRYYKNLPGLLMGVNADGMWSIISCLPPVLVGIICLLVQNKKGKFLKILYATTFVFLLIPIFGQMFNVFTYKTNRWSFICALLSSYTLVYMWDEIWNIESKLLKKVVLGLCVVIGFGFIFDLSRSLSFYSECFLAILFLYVIAYKKEDTMFSIRNRQIIIILILMITMVYRGVYLFGSYYGDYASECVDIKVVKEILGDNEVSAIEKAIEGKVKKDERYTGRNLNTNLGLLKGISGTTFYWSVSNSYISENRIDLDMEETLAYRYEGYDDKATLLALNGVKYFVKPEEDVTAIPYEFTYLKTIELGNKIKHKYKVYKSDNNLSLAYAYDTIMDKNAWDNLNSIEKQEAMLETCVIENYIGNLENKKIYTKPYTGGKTIINKETLPEGLYVKDNKIIVTKNNLSLKLNFEGKEECETYLYFDGIKFIPMYEYDFYFNSDDKDVKEIYSSENWNKLDNSQKERIREQKNRNYLQYASEIVIKHDTRCDKEVTLYTDDYAYYNGRDKYLINLNYSNSPLKEVTITFPKTGIYEYKDIKVFYHSMDNFESNIKKLKNNSMKNVKMGVDTITGTIDAKNDEMLCVNVPYSVGWKAYVDGKETKTYVANGKNIGIELNKGKHEVKLVYHTPFLRAGALISSISIILYMIFIMLNKKFYSKK